MEDEFKYESVLQKGKPVHDQYFFLRHPSMPCRKRAKIFAPFAALKGFEAEVQSKDIIYVRKRLPDLEEIAALNEKLVLLQKLIKSSRAAGTGSVTAEAEYYIPCSDPHNEAYQVKGTYETIAGPVRFVDPYRQVLGIGRAEIAFDDISELTIHQPAPDAY